MKNGGSYDKRTIDQFFLAMIRDGYKECDLMYMDQYS